MQKSYQIKGIEPKFVCEFEIIQFTEIFCVLRIDIINFKLEIQIKSVQKYSKLLTTSYKQIIMKF
jgi:hypothetical protein